jgi:hypothetical protein
MFGGVHFGWEEYQRVENWKSHVFQMGIRPTVTYALVVFSFTGTWLAQSPLHAFLHCIIKSFLL